MTGLGCSLLMFQVFMAHPPMSFEGFNIKSERFEALFKRMLRRIIDPIRSQLCSSTTAVAVPQASRGVSSEVQELSHWTEFHPACVARQRFIDKPFCWSHLLELAQIHTATLDRGNLRHCSKYSHMARSLLHCDPEWTLSNPTRWIYILSPRLSCSSL